MRIKILGYAIVVSLASAGATHANDWLQFGYDQAGSSDNPAEGSYSTAAGNVLTYPNTVQNPQPTLGSSSDSTPIFLDGVVLDAAHPDQTADILFIMSGNGILRAVKASDGTELWHMPASGGAAVNGAPAISPNDRQHIYAYEQDGKIHKFSVADGAESKAPDDPNWPQIATVKPSVDKQAAGLAIANTSHGDFLYSAMNGYGGDGGDYQGHVTTINLTNGTQKVFNMMCSQLSTHLVKNGTAGTDDCDLAGINVSHTDGEMSGIWGRPGIVYMASMDHIFFASGNGVFDANIASTNYQWGDTVMSLNSDGSGQALKPAFPLDSVTPKTFVNNYQWPADADLGSSSPAILPSTSGTFPHLAVQGGKEGCVRLFNLDDLNGHGAGFADATVAPEMNAATSCDTSGDALGAEIRTQPAVWINPADGVTWFFIATDNGIYGYRLIVASGGGVSISKTWQMPNGATKFGGTSPAVTNGTIYYVTNHAAPNTVRAMNPLDGSTIWSDSSVGGIHWQSPIVVNAHLYITDSNGKLWAYTLDGIFRNKFEVGS